ncbi:MarR family winged helix-turn-helix transcriptional regulator [Caballeronia sp. 15711]|uniref:MarR family winged helix-turn-helix transcriptional regulator n=1 Tax=Caballeronia sp. 15711 TaxID=3391029 RepID=UPI0039E70DC8
MSHDKQKKEQKYQPRGNTTGHVRDSVVADEEPLDPWNAAVNGLRELDVARYPTALLLRVATVAQTEGSAVYARRNGLTVPHWRLLHRLQESGPLAFSDLCRISNFDKAQASRVLAELCQNGLVTVADDPAHRQRRIASITKAGRELAERVLPDALTEQHRLLNVLTEEERRVTFRALCKLLAAYGYELPPSPARPGGKSTLKGKQ